MNIVGTIGVARSALTLEILTHSWRVRKAEIFESHLLLCRGNFLPNKSYSQRRRCESLFSVYVHALCVCVWCVCVCVVSIMCMRICEFARTWPTNRRRILRSIFYPAWKRYGERERRIKYSRRSRWQPKVARKLNWRTPRHESGAFDRKNSSTTLWFPFCRVRAIGGLLERF